MKSVCVSVCVAGVGGWKAVEIIETLLSLLLPNNQKIKQWTTRKRAVDYVVARRQVQFGGECCLFFIKWEILLSSARRPGSITLCEKILKPSPSSLHPFLPGPLHLHPSWKFIRPGVPEVHPAPPQPPVICGGTVSFLPQHQKQTRCWRHELVLDLPKINYTRKRVKTSLTIPLLRSQAERGAWKLAEGGV